MSELELDIKVGDTIDWHGCDAIVKDIDNSLYTLEVCGEEVVADEEEIAEQNEWAILSEE